MTQLEGLIRYWESVQKEYSYLIGPSTTALISMTISYLKLLQKLTEGEK